MMNIVDGRCAKQLTAVEHLYLRHRHLVRHRPRQRHLAVVGDVSPYTKESINDTVSGLELWRGGAEGEAKERSHPKHCRPRPSGEPERC